MPAPALDGDASARSALATRDGTAARYNFAVVQDAVGDLNSAVAVISASDAAAFYADTLAAAQQRLADHMQLGMAR